MKDVIENILKELEKQEHIHILFACESGSRAWNLHEKNSDYDVRFIYKHAKNWYLQLYEGRDVVEKNSFNKFEFVGWDLKKTLRLLNKSNPTILEWLSSPIVYRNEPIFTKEIKALAQKSFSPYTVLHHYLSMAKKNYSRLAQADSCTAKMYLTVLKPLHICDWIIENDEFPQIGLHIFEKGHRSTIIQDEIQRVFQHKQAGHNYFSDILPQYIESSIRTLEDTIKKGRKNDLNQTTSLTEFFIKTINK